MRISGSRALQMGIAAALALSFQGALAKPADAAWGGGGHGGWHSGGGWHGGGFRGGWGGASWHGAYGGWRGGYGYGWRGGWGYPGFGIGIGFPAAYGYAGPAYGYAAPSVAYTPYAAATSTYRSTYVARPMVHHATYHHLVHHASCGCPCCK